MYYAVKKGEKGKRKIIIVLLCSWIPNIYPSPSGLHHLRRGNGRETTLKEMDNDL